MKTNWCASCGAGNNFGDQLGPRLLRAYGHEVEWAPPAQAEIVTVGSVLSKIPAGWQGTVLGTGFIRPGMTADLRRARVLALRGWLTRASVKGPGRAVLGDPGILAPDLWPQTPHDGPRTAVVAPHYVDKQLALRHPDAAVADVVGPPEEFVAALARASIVYTSSLHALILADALGVPHVLEPHESVIGGLFKFQDYASAFGESIRPGRERLTDRRAMAEVQESLRNCFLALG
jgi:pyruvyltransferase